MSTNDHHASGPFWTIIKTLDWTTAYLKQYEVESPRASAEVMLAYCLNCTRIDLYLRHDQPMQQGELAQFRKLIKRRVAGEPVAYIVGRREFWSLDFKVNSSVLIPRPETECLIETAIIYFTAPAALRVLELGCGSGAITVALAHERPDWQFWALDRSPEAIQIARENARYHQRDQRIYFLVSDWFEALGNAKFDLIITNPPYIKTSDIDGLSTEIRKYEPYLALNGGRDGLSSLTRIIHSAPHYLVPGGMLMTEIGSDQRLAVYQIASGCSRYGGIDFRKDYSGLDRVAVLNLEMPVEPKLK